MPATWAEQHPAPAHTFEHDLLVHDSAQEIAEVAAGFLRAGLAAGDGAVVATGPRVAPLLAEALGNERALVLDPTDFYGVRTPAALTALRRLVEEHTPPGRRLRVVGEAVFGDTPRQWLEWQRYEAVVNESLRGQPLWSACVYDSGRLPPEVVETALRTHPQVVTAAGRQANPGFRDPADVLRALPVPDEPLERTEPLLRVDDVADFVGLRHTVGDRLADLGGSPELAEDLHLAIDEMSSNALRHGSRPVQLLLWGSAERVVCRIRDHGPGMDAPFAGYGPAHGTDLSRGGMGLWLARQLCDHVDVLDEGDGLTVRLVTSLR